jgi:hypothetical protein
VQHQNTYQGIVCAESSSHQPFPDLRAVTYSCPFIHQPSKPWYTGAVHTFRDEGGELSQQVAMIAGLLTMWIAFSLCSHGHVSCYCVLTLRAQRSTTSSHGKSSYAVVPCCEGGTSRSPLTESTGVYPRAPTKTLTSCNVSAMSLI